MKFWPLSRKYFFCSRMSEFCRKFAVFVRKLQLSATPTFFNPPTPRVSSIRTAEARALFIFIPRLHDKTGSTSWLYYVSWTSQLDVCSTFARRLLDVCLMSARCLLDRVNGVLDTSCNVVNIVSMKSRILLLKIILGKNERTDQHFSYFRNDIVHQKCSLKLEMCQSCYFWLRLLWRNWRRSPRPPMAVENFSYTIFQYSRW